MTQSLIREPNGNVVLRSDNFTQRFFHLWGGSPLEWWSEPFPLLTNSFPGSGASTSWEMGQDPTQASASGFIENPIAPLNQRANIYNYYVRESVFNPSGMYEITGFAPDFWISAEPIDDAIAPDPTSPDSGWRTKYQPGNFGPVVNQWTCPVVFEGKPTNFSGLFFPGNEMKTGPWNQRLRSYGIGNIAFKVNISLQHGNPSSLAGIFFRLQVPETPGANKNTAYEADGLHLFINPAGGYALHKIVAGHDTILFTGQLTKSQKKNLMSGAVGLQVEVRTDNALPNRIQIYFDDALAETYVAQTPMGPHFCLFAQTTSGYVWFGNRRVFDTSMEFVSRYTALPNATIRSDQMIRSAISSRPARTLYRGAMPCVFLNQTTFTTSNRKCRGHRKSDDAWVNIDGLLCPIRDYEAFFIGNLEGTAGVKGEPVLVTVNGKPSDQAHVLAQSHSFNDEFILSFNPLPPMAELPVTEMRMIIDWTTIQ